VLEFGFDDPRVVREQIGRYAKAGFPPDYGLFACCMMVKRHHSSRLRAMCDCWAEEYLAGSRRDQLSLTYASWKHARTTGEPLNIKTFDFDEVYVRRQLFIINHHIRPRVWSRAAPSVQRTQPTTKLPVSVGHAPKSGKSSSRTSGTFAYCTLAIHAPYRQRARLLCADLAGQSVVVFTDEPSDFSDLPVIAIRHEPVGLMAREFLRRQMPASVERGSPAYHDKRFLMERVLRDFHTAIFLDADCRIRGAVPELRFSPGLALGSQPSRSVAQHLQQVGSWRLPFFMELLAELRLEPDLLDRATFCFETCMAVTKGIQEERFFELWGRAAEFLHARGVFYGEGGVIGLAAAGAGWEPEIGALSPISQLIEHEGGGPKGHFSAGTLEAGRPTTEPPEIVAAATSKTNDQTGSNDGKAPQVMLLVLGMHRSGTSVAAKMLECLGAVSSTNLLPPDPDNPRGHFEDADVGAFNEYTLLPALGSMGSSLLPLDLDTLESIERQKLAAEAREILQRNYRQYAPLSVLNDPRIAILLPFWLPVLREAGFNVKVVCVVRDPLDVARSIRSRNGFPIIHGALLYAKYWAAILAGVKSTPLVLVAFKDLLADPRIALQHIAKHFDIGLPPEFPEHVAALQASFLDASTLTDSQDADPPAAVEEVPAEVTALHEALLHAVRTQDHAPAEHQAETTATDLAGLAPLLYEIDWANAGRLGLFRTRQRQAYQLEVADFRLSKLGLTHRESIQRDAAAIERLREALAAEERTTETLRASTSWRVTSPLRRLVELGQRIAAMSKWAPVSVRALLRGRSRQLFDPEWYLRENPDVHQAGWNPLFHYALHGVFEGRIPTPNSVGAIKSPDASAR